MLVFTRLFSLRCTDSPRRMDGASKAPRGRGSCCIVPGDNDSMQSTCEQRGGSRYRRQRSHRDSGPSSEAEHIRGSDGEQRCPDPAGKCARHPWDLQSPALRSQLRRTLDNKVERLARSVRTDGNPTASHSVCLVVATLDSLYSAPERSQAGTLLARTAGEDEDKDTMLTNWQRRKLHDGEKRDRRAPVEVLRLRRRRTMSTLSATMFGPWP